MTELVCSSLLLTSLNRQSNITLLQTYGSNAWRVQNYLMEHTTKGIEKALEEVRERTTEVNRDRKQNQVWIRLPILFLSSIMTLFHLD